LKLNLNLGDFQLLDIIGFVPLFTANTANSISSLLFTKC